MNRFAMMLLCAAVWIAAPVLSAHDEYRIIGTIFQVSGKTLDVTQRSDGQTMSMKMDAATLVTRDGKKVDVKELRKGLSVVVDARGDSLQDLEVLEVRIVPPPSKKSE